jgi:hypothetical protein
MAATEVFMTARVSVRQGVGNPIGKRLTLQEWLIYLFETTMKTIVESLVIRQVPTRRAAGKAEASPPFPESLTKEGRNIWFSTLKAHGAEELDLERIASEQPLYLDAIGAHLKWRGDPDWKIFAQKIGQPLDWHS